MRMLQLTASEVATLPADTNVYEGVGKMYALPPTSQNRGHPLQSAVLKRSQSRDPLSNSSLAGLSSAL
jgi:hypothetical protein